MEQKPQERKKLMAVGVIVVVLLVLGIVGVVVSGLLNGSGTKNIGIKNDSATSDYLYDALANAAQQSKLRVAMYRVTYANKADADAKQNIGTEASSVAEVDLGASTGRSVYATNAAKPPEFTTGRCIDGVTYSDDYDINKTARPITLEAASNELQGNKHLYRSNVPIFTPCPNMGPITGAAVDLAAFRLSDGVFPVTITQPQAEDWKGRLKTADLFDVKDEGMIEYKGKQVKKIRFTPKEEKTVNGTLYDIFYASAEIERIKAEHGDRAIFEYEFISANPANTGDIGGYYLIDDAKKLPVYSELYSTNPDKEFGKPGARFNIARTKQTYEFGKPLSLTLEAPLEILK